jgi:hypothetical protein
MLVLEEAIHGRLANAHGKKPKSKCALEHVDHARDGRQSPASSEDGAKPRVKNRPRKDDAD